MTPPTRQLPWTLADIDFAAVEVAQVRDDATLFLLVCGASFVESASHTYACNLVERFAADAEVADWLRAHWEPEELQHGRALEAYVRRVWPEFDWDGAYAGFLAEYARLCTPDDLEPTRGQEMAARCIVEMGTTTYYQALHAACAEPVLRALAWRIRGDEVRHYKHFHAFFLKYRRRDRLGRRHVLAALVRRAFDLRREDTTIALRHAAAWREGAAFAPTSAGVPATADDLTRQAYRRVRSHLPMELAVRMAIQPLQLGSGLRRWMVRPLAALGAGLLRD